jgi:FAD synthetase
LHLQLSERGLAPEIIRIGKYEDGDLCSSRFVVQRIIEVRGKKENTRE